MIAFPQRLAHGRHSVNAHSLGALTAELLVSMALLSLGGRWQKMQN